MKKSLLILVIVSIFLIGGFNSVLAQTQVGTATAMAQPVVVKAKLDLPCIKKAIEARETAIINAYDKKVSAIKSALEQRKVAILSAWGQNTVAARAKAIAAARKTFITTRKQANSVYIREAKAAWQQFKNDKKACRVTEQGTTETSATDLAL